jgi:hypothetical protein
MREAEAKCWNTTTTPPARCAGYELEREAFVIHAVRVPGTFEMRQCSRGTDHVLVDGRTTTRTVLEVAGYDCSLVVGFPYSPGAGLPASQTEFAYRCPLYRWSYTTTGGTGAHLFSQGAESFFVGLTCEPPPRADVYSSIACFSSAPPGC